MNIEHSLKTTHVYTRIKYIIIPVITIVITFVITPVYTLFLIIKYLMYNNIQVKKSISDMLYIKFLINHVVKLLIFLFHM